MALNNETILCTEIMILEREWEGQDETAFT